SASIPPSKSPPTCTACSACSAEPQKTRAAHACALGEPARRAPRARRPAPPSLNTALRPLARATAFFSRKIELRDARLRGLDAPSARALVVPAGRSASLEMAASGPLR